MRILGRNQNLTIVMRTRHEAGFHRGFRQRLSDAEKPGVNPAPCWWLQVAAEACCWFLRSHSNAALRGGFAVGATFIARIVRPVSALPPPPLSVQAALCLTTGVLPRRRN